MCLGDQLGDLGKQLLGLERRHTLGDLGVALGLGGVGAVLLGPRLRLGDLCLSLGLLDFLLGLALLLLACQVLLHLLFGGDEARHVQLLGDAVEQLAPTLVTDDAKIDLDRKSVV